MTKYPTVHGDDTRGDEPNKRIFKCACADVLASAVIGKGKRSKEVVEALVRNGGVYFAAIGGAGALLSKAITSAEVVAYNDLGTEAIHKLEVKDFPVIVVIDSCGNNLYESAIKEFCTLED